MGFFHVKQLDLPHIWLYSTYPFLKKNSDYLLNCAWMFFWLSVNMSTISYCGMFKSGKVIIGMFFLFIHSTFLHHCCFPLIKFLLLKNICLSCIINFWPTSCLVICYWNVFKCFISIKNYNKFKFYFCSFQVSFLLLEKG